MRVPRVVSRLVSRSMWCRDARSGALVVLYRVVLALLDAARE